MTSETRAPDEDVQPDDVTPAEDEEIEITGFEGMPADAPPPAAGVGAHEAGTGEPCRAGESGGEEESDRGDLESGGPALDGSPEAVIATLEGDLLRIRADFENFRRRSLREKEDFQRRAAEGLLQRLLPAIDNFKRAMVAGSENDADGGFREGMTMIFRQFMEALENEGLEQIETTGVQFDPNLHEAVARDETSEVEANAITAELEPGYRFRGRLLKPARVRVAVRPPDPS